mgnify:CR=1 FL=1
MQLLGEVHRLEPTRESPLEITRHTRLTIARARFERSRRICITVATRDRKTTITLDEIEQRDAALIAQHFADELTEHVDVVTQRGVLLGKLDLGAFHSRILHPEMKRPGRLHARAVSCGESPPSRISGSCS